MTYPTYEEIISKGYRDIIKNDLERILIYAGAIKNIRSRVDDPFTKNGNESINVVYPEEIFIPNNFWEFSKDLKSYAMIGKQIEDMEINHFRVVRIFDNDKFELRLRKEYRDLAGILDKHPEYLKVDGFVAKEQVLIGGEFIPVVYIRKSLTFDIYRFFHVKRHKDSHAFSMGFEKPEKLFGYCLDDDGESEVLVRDQVDEYIANLETGEELKESHKPIFYCGDKKGFKNLYEKNKTAVEEAKSKMLLENHIDLANLLRIIPVQKMDELLPRVIELYLEKYNNGIPVLSPIPK